MMNLDIILVTYNSEKWIQSCFSSILNSHFDLKKVSLIVVDNHSSDNTLTLLYNEQKKHITKFNEIKIISNNQNTGFGCANNLGSQNCSGDIILFLNIDTEIFSDTLENLEKEILSSSKSVAVWELRQVPYEHPKLYSPSTKETSWCSGAAFAVRRNIFEEVGGFDNEIFMYAEDVDLSWNIRQHGYTLHYLANVKVKHFCYQTENELKPTQYINSIINNLYLRYKYGNVKDILEGHILYWSIILLHHSVFKDSKKVLLIQYFKLLKKTFQIQKITNTAKFFPKFINFDYEITRDGNFYQSGELTLADMPLVSIIVRTCGRPEVLRETLESLKNQTYPNIQIVIVEDGKNISESLIKTEYSSLNIIYKSTGINVGRSVVGNIGMSIATGEYFNFLDDDDLFFADHVETLITALQNTSCLAAYATGFETPIEVFSTSPYKYHIFQYNKVHHQKFDKIILAHHNYIPIQCIMFHRSLFEKYGGLDESLDALEDWDLWVRYSLFTDFLFVNKTTSIYRVPHNASQNQERQKKLDDALIVVRNKHKNYIQKLSIYEIAQLYENKCK